MAMQMVMELCVGDKQKLKKVENVSLKALERRIGLWDAIQEKILYEDLSSI
jgi:hypothetical protein